MIPQGMSPAVFFNVLNQDILNLPPVQLQLRPDTDSRRGGMEVFDPLRSRWVALTPEERVRQHFVAFLIRGRGCPAAFMANEISLKLNGTARRCDTVIFDRALRPLAIVEYKAPSIALNQKVFDQIARYNSVLGAPFLIVSNGKEHYCCRYSRGKGYSFLADVPAYAEMAQNM